MSEQMKAVVLAEFGGPDVLGQITDVAMPQPGSHDILIEVHACAVCYLDSIVRAGIRPGIQLPLILGHEIAGTVAELGPEVVGFTVGDRVSTTYRAVCGHCYYCRAENSALCLNVQGVGVERNGGYAQFVSLPSSSVSRVPDGVSYDQATIAGCVLGAVYKGVVGKGKVHPGDNVLVTGAGGGAGMHAVQLAANSGAFVVASTTSASKIDAIKKAGADEVVLGTEDAVVSRVQELTAGRGVEVVLDCVGKATSRLSFRSLARGGRLVLIGELGVQPINVSIPRMLYRETEIYGVASPSAGELTTVLNLIDQGKITPTIDRAFPLAEAAKAHQTLAEGSNVGRLVLHP